MFVHSAGLFTSPQGEGRLSKEPPFERQLASAVLLLDMVTTVRGEGNPPGNPFAAAATGLEPATLVLTGQRSTVELRGLLRTVSPVGALPVSLKGPYMGPREIAE